MLRVVKNIQRGLATASKGFTNKTSNLDRATLTIKDGPIFSGYSFGANKNVSGEAVFTTSLVGYPESMTDPS
jgi:carbamoyl-phosphate synthase small subunit